MRRIYSILLLFWVISSSAQQVDQLQHEIEQSEAEIARISAQLASNRDKQIESNTQIRLLEKRLKLRQNLVRQNSSKILSLVKTLRSYDSQVLLCGSAIDSIKSSYSSLVLSFRDFYLYNSDFPEYNSSLLQVITSYSSYKIDSLDNVISKTGIARSDVVRQKAEMDKLLSKRKQEVEQILKETSQLDSLKRSLKLVESKMLSQIESHRSKINQLQREIERIISLDMSKSSAENVALTHLIKQSVGNLPSPLCVKCRIVDEYGVHNHPTIKGVKVSNKGVNLAFVGSSLVKSIAEGEVRGVYSIAGMANTVLIRHGQFISVYANLTSVSVSKGDKISQGQTIGRIAGSDSEELFFHFELWQESKTLNPVLWVKF